MCEGHPPPAVAPHTFFRTLAMPSGLSPAPPVPRALRSLARPVTPGPAGSPGAAGRASPGRARRLSPAAGGGPGSRGAFRFWTLLCVAIAVEMIAAAEIVTGRLPGTEPRGSALLGLLAAGPPQQRRCPPGFAPPPGQLRPGP
ncbi:MAG TPA: hypothetical protein DEQ61_07585 [Streptomyces sp.]|nr:hypothetical protein [Streptomyces sp.]